MWKGGRDGRTDKDFILQHDNASSHTAIITIAKLGESGIELLAHPPYSPDLAPADYFLFPYLKSKLRGEQFGTIQEMQQRVKLELCRIPEELFDKAIHDLSRRWLKCIKNEGKYFEGQGIDIETEYAALDIAFEESELSSDEESEQDTSSDQTSD